MGLKQIKKRDRIPFLTIFSAELMNNSLKDQEIKKAIAVQKLKQKFIEPISQQEQAPETMIQSPLFQPSQYAKKQTIHQEIKQEFPRQMHQRERIMHRMVIPKKRFFQKLKRKIYRQQAQIPLRGANPVIPPRIQILTQTRPTPQPRPAGLDLGKLEPLLADASIQSIECPGPGKNVLVKRYNLINITKVNLNQAEISDIINNFATKAKIPIVGGILKAAVGDMVISAVISEFVGSRFIISKITPYSLIEKD